MRAKWEGMRRNAAIVLENRSRGADLSGAKLSGANLNGADLSWADLRGADLTGTIRIQDPR